MSGLQRHQPAGLSTPAASAGPGAVRDLRPRFLRADGASVATIGPFAGKDSTVDPIGLATVLRLGYALGTRTVLAGVSTDAVVPDGFADARAPSQDELVELVLTATRDRLAGTSPTVLLSGGRDSRLILLSMHQIGARPSAILTLAQPGAASDCAIAHRIAGAIGEPISSVVPSAFDGVRELDRHERQSFQSLEHGWFVDLAARVHAGGGPVTDGIGAGVLSTGSLLEAEPIAHWRAGEIAALFDWTASHGAYASEAFLAAAAAEGFPIAPREAVLAEFESVLASLANTPNPLGMYSLLHWTRRGISASAYGLLPHDRVATPLYDERLCRAVAAIPMDEARATDWRETVLARIDRTGVPFATGEHAMLPRWMRAPVRTVRSRLAWSRFVADLPRPLANLARVADRSAGRQRVFDRSALGLLAALDRLVGFTGR